MELFAEAAEEFPREGVADEIEATMMVDPDQPPFRILVIEDDQANSLLLKRVLEGAGFQIRTAEDGETGIGIFREWHPHLIWLDIHLPGMNGIGGGCSDPRIGRRARCEDRSSHGQRIR